MPIEEHSATRTIVDLATTEAFEAGHSGISTAHLLIALSRFTEEQDQSESAASKAVSREFELMGIEPRKFRRRLRGILGRRDRTPDRTNLNIADGAKAVLAAAAREAAASRETMMPVRLLRCAFASLGEDGAGPPVAHRAGDDIPAEL